ncbi:phage tail tape measure protein [Anabaena catenula]|uniref:Phage tail tape measure protein n=1 Tax=Anabaena catenula FACHB-362 TaxID=2692877 RepID=A0ABR8J7T5_9NOST|nr:phage tail tape measure protein [Anabaena catenula]MBD2694434.1 phage tail tape measure protein [Anabaena catenula FACHB-362]
MATRRLSVKFDTEGFNQAVSQLQQTGRAFDSALQRARQASREAVAAQRAASRSGDVAGEVAAQRRIEQSATAANRAIAASYRELGVRSSESINQMRARAVAAFEAIKNSGTASARDIAAAQDALNNKLQDLDSQLDDTGKTARDGGGGFDILTAAIGAATLALGGFIRASYQVGKASDTSVRALSTLTGDSAGLYKELQALSKELGYQVTATELATTGYDVLSAGFNKTADVIEILKNSQKAAVGGFAEIGVVADAVTTILNAYGKGVGETEKVTSQFIQTQNDGKIVVSQYAQQIGGLASTAAASNVSLEELNATVSVATASGVRVESAFTGLRQAISSIVKPSAEAEKVAEKLGIKFDAATLKQKGFAAVLEDVRKKAGGNAQALGILFGSVEAVAAVQPALNDFEKFTGFIERQKNAAGEADKAFQKMNGSIVSSEKSLSGVANAIKNKAWESFGLIIKPISAAIAGMGNAFLALPTPIQSTIIVLTSLTVTVAGTVAAFKILNAALATVGITNKLRSLVELELVLRNLRATGISFKAFQISQFVTNIGASFNLAAGFIGFYTKALIEAINIQRIAAVQFVTSGGLLTALGSAFTFLISPIGLIIVGLAALTAAFVVLYTKSELFRKGVNFLGELLKTIFLDAVNVVKEAFNALGRAISAVGKSIDWFATGTGKNFDKLLLTLGNFGKSTLDYLGSLADWLANLDMFKPLVDSAKNAAAGIKGAFGGNNSPVNNFLSDGPLGLLGIKPMSAVKNYIGGLFGRTQERIDKESTAEKPNQVKKTQLSPAPKIPTLTGGAGVDVKGDSGGSSGSSGSNKEKEFVDFELLRPKGTQTSGYGMRKGRMHNGVDFSQGRERNRYPIEALLPGKVSEVGFDKGGWGNYVVVKSIDRLGKVIEVLQAHLDSVVVTKGEEVKQGQLLGREGSTGRSTGTHNHVEVKIGGKRVNPSDVLGKRFSLSSELGSPSDILKERDAKAQALTPQQKTVAGVIAMAKRLGMNPEDLLRVMLLETGGTLSPKAHGNGAVGLIGFTKDNQKELGVTLGQLAKMTAEEQLPYVEKYLKIHARGQKLDSLEKVSATVYGGNPGVKLDSKPDGRLSLRQYVGRAKDRYSSQANKLIGEVDETTGDTLEVKAAIAEQAKDDAKLARDRAYEEKKTQATLAGELKRRQIENSFAAAKNDLEKQLAGTKEEQEKTLLERRIASLDSDKESLQQNNELATERAQVEFRINQLMAERATLTQEELDELNSLENRRQAIHATRQDQLAQEARAVALREAENTAADQEADRQYRQGLAAIFTQVTLAELTEEQRQKFEQHRTIEEAYNERRLEIERLIQEAKTRGDQQALTLLSQMSTLNESRRQKELQQVADQYDQIKQLYATVKDSARDATQQFFEDIFTGTRSLGDALNSLLTSILKAVAQMAAANITKSIFSSFGGAGFASGGYVSGPGTGTSDSIAARLSNGEFVMRAKAVKHWGTNFLDSLNTMQTPALSLATAGVGSSAGGSSRSQTIVMNVSTPDANSFRKSGSQLGRDAAEQLRRGMNRNG